jgi:hypothetical protein
MAGSTLLDRLRTTEILSADQLEELAGLSEAGDPDPRVLGKVILQRGWLTTFQISLIAAGKGKELFLGSYVLLDRLGEGGMGQVFKARHRHMNRLVALKLVRKEKLSGADSVQRFYREVQAAGASIVMAFNDVGIHGEVMAGAGLPGVEGHDERQPLANQARTPAMMSFPCSGCGQSKKHGRPPCPHCMST